MKLKYQFIVRKVAGSAVAVAVGDHAEEFNGMIKLNPTAEFIFEKLNNGDFSSDELAKSVCEAYNIDLETAVQAVSSLISSLKSNGLLI